MKMSSQRMFYRFKLWSQQSINNVTASKVMRRPGDRGLTSWTQTRPGKLDFRALVTAGGCQGFGQYKRLSTTSRVWNEGKGKSESPTQGDSTSAFTKQSCNTEENETFGQPIHRFGSSYKREQASYRFDAFQNVNDQQSTGNYQSDLAADHHADVYNHMPSVSLASCMQSQVPQPYGRTPPHMNMPGGMNRLEDKYIQGRISDIQTKREYSTTVGFGDAIPGVDEHGNLTYTTESSIERMLHGPCPQGVQGEDCEQFKLWLSNCLYHGDLKECEQLANEYIAGRLTLAQIFLQYDLEIKKVAADIIASKSKQVGTEHTVKFSSSANDTVDSQSSNNQSSASPSGDGKKNDRVARLKAAVKDYGSTVIVFHVGISLASLGFFYTLIASNIDVFSILQYFNITLGSAQSSVETASTFAVAYAVHKIFAPVRIGITLTCAPLIVRSLRARGILKTPLSPKK